jgi:competence protein ComEA
MKRGVSDYFDFSRNDRIGILVLIGLILVTWILPRFITPQSPLPSSSDTAWIAALRKLEYKQQSERDSSNTHFDDNPATYQYNKRANTKDLTSPVFFEFDPNSLPGDGWKKLGLHSRTIGTILRYRTKGGRFRKPEDLQRVYGLSPSLYKKLEPYIRIELKNQTHGHPDTTNNWKRFQKRSIPAELDINHADTSAFIALPGIGNKLAGRIVNFREKLGGFYSISQVAETYGLADSVFQTIKSYLRLEKPALRKININTATVDELKMHPYIRFTIANSIVRYRNEHGAFARVEDILKVHAITQEIYNKANPYLTVE